MPTHVLYGAELSRRGYPEPFTVQLTRTGMKSSSAAQGNYLEPSMKPIVLVHQTHSIGESNPVSLSFAFPPFLTSYLCSSSPISLHLLTCNSARAGAPSPSRSHVISMLIPPHPITPSHMHHPICRRLFVSSRCWRVCVIFSILNLQAQGGGRSKVSLSVCVSLSPPSLALEIVLSFTLAFTRVGSLPL